MQVVPSEPGVLEGFSDAACRAIATAEAEARRLGHDHIGSEHLVLGLLANRASATARALNDAGVNLTAARAKVAEAVGPRATGEGEVTGPLPASARASRALERALRFANQRRSEAVASNHLLLAVLDVEGRAGQVLRGFGIDIGKLRRALETIEESDDEGQAAPAPKQPRRGSGAKCPSCAAALDELSFKTMTAHGERKATREALVFSCAACGHVLGVTPA